MATVKRGTTVPVIDLSDFLAGGDPGPAAAAVRDACENVGFFQVTGHRVPQELLDGVVASMNELVALPQEVRDGMSSPTGHPFRGVRTERDDVGDIRVSRLQVNVFDDGDAAVAAGVPVDYSDYFHPNVWPTQVPGLPETWRACFAATRDLGRSIMQLFALALALPQDHFDEALKVDVSTFSANHYPAQEQLSTPDDPRVIFPAHTDSGVLTVLYQTGDYTGLQVFADDRSWIDIPVVPDSFVINIGDLMARWTNGRWKSTTHRVIAAYEPGRSRVSIPTFYLPAIDTVVEPLPSCVDDGGPRYEPVTPYEWEAIFLERSRKRLARSGFATY
ncbi:isopenicillin N synthase family dioxygenase [Geodermatophilus sp. SYSU D00815]